MKVRFVSKLEGALQELDETDLWLEWLGHSDVIKGSRIAPLRAETNELIAIFVTILKRAKTS